ncbi:MAG: 1-deoxy-D-xylulose-5-phosphate reductoisomerase, partial [Thermoleophilaceae bacterium]
MRRIAILGSTGSIGTQALDVVERSSELEVVALADEAAAARASEAWTGGEVLAGPDGLVSLITETECDLVLNALVGSAGLGPTIAALGEG